MTGSLGRKERATRELIQYRQQSSPIELVFRNSGCKRQGYYIDIITKDGALCVQYSMRPPTNGADPTRNEADNGVYTMPCYNLSTIFFKQTAKKVNLRSFGKAPKE